MNLDDLMIVISLGGIGLSIAYLRAQFVWRSHTKVAERRDQRRLRELNARTVLPATVSISRSTAT